MTMAVQTHVRGRKARRGGTARLGGCHANEVQCDSDSGVCVLGLESGVETTSVVTAGGGDHGRGRT